jgi:SAM-dependent methyltransferase
VKATRVTVKDFDKAYKENGAYHVLAKGFDAWFLEENYSSIARFCEDDHAILDIGCGEGRLSDFLKTKHLDGVDYLQSAIELNKETYGLRYRRLVQAHLKDLGEIGLANASYDRIVCSLTLMYLTRDELIQCLTAARRLLKHDGLFVATYPNSTPLRAPSAESYELNARELQLAFAEADFETNKLIPIFPFLPQHVVQASYVDDAVGTAREAYLSAKAQMDMTNSYHFLIMARKASAR